MGEYDLGPGAVFAGYTIERVLGVGGFGAVYLARHPNLPRLVALKLLSRGWTSDDGVRARFELEADHAARLEHPNIVAVYDRGREGDQMWIAMQYVPGTDAAKVLAGGPLPVEQAVHIVAETAKALDYANAAGVLHRDVKPANILLEQDQPGRPGRVLLADFGIAKALVETAHLTKTGMLVASLQYAAPEQFDNTALDGRADVYALGGTLFHLLAGQQPYPGSTLPLLMHGHLNLPIPQPSQVRPGLPPTFDAVIARALAKNREDRYPSCGALAAAARAALEPATDVVSQPVTEQVTEQVNEQVTEQVTERVLSEDPPTVRLAEGQTVHGGIPVRSGPHVRDDRSGGSGAARQAPTPLTPDPPGRQLPEIRRGQQSHPMRPRRPWWRRKSTAMIAVLAVVLGVGTYVTWLYGQDSSTTQVVLPFTGLSGPAGVAVTPAGDVYVTDLFNNRVLTLAAGQSTQTELPFTGLHNPNGVAVDDAGNVYIADAENDRVLTLAAGSSTQTELPFTGLKHIGGVAVDAAGNVFVAFRGNDRVVTLAAGPSTQTVLHFTDLAPIGVNGVAVSAAGDVYVTDTYHDRVVTLAAGSSTQTALPFTRLSDPAGVAVNDAGDVYVSDRANSRVLKLSAGSSTQTELPFTGLYYPQGVAVDDAGNVYVADAGNDRVLKLPADG